MSEAACIEDEAVEELHLLRIGLRQGPKLVSAALDCSTVQEVIESPRLEPLPGPAGVMRGVVEVRGVPVPVIPLGRGLGAVDADNLPTDSPRLVICGLPEGVVAFQVAQIQGITVCDETQLQPLPGSMSVLGGIFCCDNVLREESGYRFVIDVSRCLRSLISPAA